VIEIVILIGNHVQMCFIVCSCCCLTIFLSLFVFVEVFKGKNSDTNHQSLTCFLSFYSFSFFLMAYSSYFFFFSEAYALIIHVSTLLSGDLIMLHI